MDNKQTFASISPMNSPYLNEKKKLILTDESDTSRQLALHVIDKPLPRVWMIFIPILFVFYFWKLKEYENGLKTFAEHHLIPRRESLAAAFAAKQCGFSVDIALLVDKLGKLDTTKRALAKEWLTVLVGHYQLLLNAEGDSYHELVRSGYRNKSNYLLFCEQICRTENTFNMALLESIDGDSAALCARLPKQWPRARKISGVKVLNRFFLPLFQVQV